MPSSADGGSHLRPGIRINSSISQDHAVWNSAGSPRATGYQTRCKSISFVSNAVGARVPFALVDRGIWPFSYYFLLHVFLPGIYMAAIVDADDLEHRRVRRFLAIFPSANSRMFAVAHHVYHSSAGSLDPGPHCCLLQTNAVTRASIVSKWSCCFLTL